ncbi:MAG: sigma-70 family RNA polymerase sigma factor [Odoribacteraceae bacterium]|jgi:RNA polymerase sigma-70 factor (ECF subfamily)|nr:sigma-70 family RNA polymerase sigma factor [Odoribacteraceae bacterium]
MIDDHDILIRFKANPREGMKMLFDKYYAALVVHAERFLGDRARAEDVVQEFYIRLWREEYLERVAVHALPSYLHAGVRNACYTARVKRDVLRDAVDLEQVEIPVGAFESVNDERAESVRKAIERLPERTRLVVQGVMVDGQSYKEVAAELSVSVNTVKYLLKEGVRKLRAGVANGAREVFLFLFGRKRR